MTQQFGDVSVEIGDDFVAVVEIHRPPTTSSTSSLIRSLAEAYTTLDADPSCRAIVLASEGKHFCAGADFSGQSQAEALPREGAASLYREAVRLFRAEKPVVAVVQGAAIGGGLGLACSADFRVAAPEARFAANFAQLGFHQGFGLTRDAAADHRSPAGLELLYLGRRISGEEAYRIGLCDRLVPLAEVRDRGPGAGRRDRHLRPAGHPFDPPDHAGASGRGGGRRHRPRGRRAGPPAHRPATSPKGSGPWRERRPPKFTGQSDRARSLPLSGCGGRRPCRRGRAPTTSSAPMTRAKIRSALRVTSP